MQVNLRMESVHLREQFSISWLCESGLVKNIEQVVEEYKKIRGLQVSTEAESQHVFVQRICLCQKKYYVNMLKEIC